MAICVSLFGVPITAARADRPESHDCFTIHVVDEATGRGVPLVELRTTAGVRSWTDSAGVVAFDEPGLMGLSVFFYVSSDGYEFPKDGFGFRGKALEVTPGGTATLKIRRLNIAERLYRVTGAGIYRDTVLTGGEPPIEQPLLNAQVTGSDSVVSAVYRGRIHWFWGDTNRPKYPLGNFHVPGATSELPGEGGLDPAVGVNLNYFTAADGFAKPTCRMPGEGPTWIHGLVTVPDGRGDGGNERGERMFAHYVKVKPPLSVYRRGLAEWDDDAQEFKSTCVFPDDMPVHPGGHTFRHVTDGVEYVYFAMPCPLIRVRATREALQDPSQYEAFTCLVPRSTTDDAQSPDSERPAHAAPDSKTPAHALDRDADGRLRYGWKRNTPLVGPQEQRRLVREKQIEPGEGLVQLQDRDSGKPWLAHAGSVSWNDDRRRWVMIAVEQFGASFLGEVWYAEADTPVGPWCYAVKVVTHEKYSFYNPKQHPFFDQDGGRTIYFEGTYTASFSGNEHPTPRYEYNQIMYRLDLADPR
ncbi:MAG TPA: hypothetical protein VML55_25640, partial [Planctomycetaceae bacterium]|nr:hypothetical protein [Planctomycetaceae bacterium]